MDGMLQGVYLPLRKTENIADDLRKAALSSRLNFSHQLPISPLIEN